MLRRFAAAADFFSRENFLVMWNEKWKKGACVHLWQENFFSALGGSETKNKYGSGEENNDADDEEKKMQYMWIFISERELFFIFFV